MPRLDLDRELTDDEMPCMTESADDEMPDQADPDSELSDNDDDFLQAMADLAGAKRHRPRDAQLAERARTFKAAKRAQREKEHLRQKLENARNKVRELKPGVLTTFTPEDICLQGFTRAYKGSKLSDRYHKLQNFMMSLLASGIEHTQDLGLEKECERALRFSRAGGSVVLGSQMMYDETNQRLSVPPEFAKGRVGRVGNSSAPDEHNRIKNMTCPVLVRSASVCFEYIPAADPGSGHTEIRARDVGVSGCSDVGVLGCSSADREACHDPHLQPWILRPHVLHGKSTMYMLRALSSQWPLHVSNPLFAVLWRKYLQEGIRVHVDVDNRDDAAPNRSYVAQAAGEAQAFFQQAGCSHRQVRHSHRCDIHQVGFNALLCSHNFSHWKDQRGCGAVCVWCVLLCVVACLHTRMRCVCVPACVGMRAFGRTSVPACLRLLIAVL